ncbi:Esa1p-associated factor [Kappamyces sp. JEL0680]|nr:Esa1p-associated factor [Kappamyces sp. JEL0680]
MKPDETLYYEDKEKVLCYHGPLMYEAKVLKAEYWRDRADLPDGAYYFVHYQGWKTTWDEWVPESRMMKFTEENKQMAADMAASVKKKKVVPEKKIVSNVDHEAKEKKRRRESMALKVRWHDLNTQEEEYLKKPEIKISIPESLKSQLVDDWENVTKNHKLVPLPAPLTVTQLLDEFMALHSEGTKKSRRDGLGGWLSNRRNTEDSMKQVVEGLKVYFDKALGNILLYRFERHQYVDAVREHPHASMCDIYGPEHLLRLFGRPPALTAVQLPSLIAHTNMDQDAVNILKDHFATILQYARRTDR